MRDIKFRGLNTKGQWVYGSLVVTTVGLNTSRGQHTKTWIIESAFGNGGWFNIMKRQYVYPKTVGQYIEKNDKNDAKIFDGDILAFNHKTDPHGIQKLLAYVCYEAVGFTLKHITDSFLDGLIDLSSSVEFEVVGSIHKNHELLLLKDVA